MSIPADRYLTEGDDHSPQALPGALLRGERLLWQGGCNWWRLACQAFHLRAVGAWFALLLVFQLVQGAGAGDSVATLLHTALWYVLLAVAGMGVVALLAWLYARSMVFSLTSSRVVIRGGVALPVTVNIPLRLIEGAAVRHYRDGTSDVPLLVSKDQHVSWLLLWPCVRPWHVLRPQPMLRAIEDGERVAELLADALTATAVPERPVRVSGTGAGASARGLSESTAHG